MVAPFGKFYGKTWVSFCLNTGKRFFLEVLFSSQQKEHILWMACFYHITYIRQEMSRSFLLEAGAKSEI